MLKLTKAYNREGFLLNTYYNPVRTYQGVGSLSVLPQLVNGLNPKKNFAAYLG